MKWIQILNLFSLALATFTLLGGCTTDDDFSRLPTHFHDDFDGFIMEFTDENGKTLVIKQALHIFHDHDGDGKDDHGHGKDGDLQSHSYRGVVLSKNTTYKVKIRLVKVLEGGDTHKLDKVEDVTEKIKDFSDQHLFCFQFKDSSKPMADIERTDLDINGHEVGFETLWKTGDGEDKQYDDLIVQLRHQRDKNGENCDIGATELIATFNIVVI